MTTITNIINCAIVDDEPLPVDLLSDYINRTPGLQLVCVFRNPLELLQAMEQYNIHILFLDMQMPELTGFQLAKLLKGRCEFVVTTAYPKYALEGYEYDVADYLLKPFSFERFLAAINKCKKRLFQKYPEANDEVSHFFVKTGNRLRKVYHKEVLYLEAMRDYIAIHLPGEKIMTLQSLSSFEEQLPAAFIRIHRSYIINTEKIVYVEKNAVIIESTTLPIGSKYQHRLSDII
ncbi:LytR/AlgR family response regulator transcription factor [Gynurincola endophyticus]|uniref:LytR/AlgR family response regulator transcription factor n=1 Tax=Gynurincola endophyticus TaxID=2479004 RepID=UPI000F8CD8A1|nr:LytTR family DNA-binding domain-containing protein [Gynurincola endophyticus]